jgi:hypothetical protein
MGGSSIKRIKITNKWILKTLSLIGKFQIHSKAHATMHVYYSSFQVTMPMPMVNYKNYLKNCCGLTLVGKKASICLVGAFVAPMRRNEVWVF